MTNFLSSTIPHVLIVIVVLLPCCVRSMNNHSLFEFTHIDKKSPDDIEESCLTINKRTPGTLFFGIKLFINNTSKNAFCPSKNVELKTIWKDIIHDKHDRPLCRTTLTVSINSIQCEKTVVELSLLCQGNEYLSVYFQDCKEVSYGVNETNTDAEKAISMSALPAPVIGNHGPVYIIPTVQCIVNPDALGSFSTHRLSRTSINVAEIVYVVRTRRPWRLYLCVAGSLGIPGTTT
uniref:Uncharacterized protein LOC111108831 n=1 Tax=Crassostrea virginica TaxID=6565 RepID=A0A8B8BB24_CRAVI|nr:uncharacterized protein LOC111108831 [Crassostrea virginica]